MNWKTIPAALALALALSGTAPAPAALAQNAVAATVERPDPAAARAFVSELVAELTRIAAGARGQAREQRMREALADALAVDRIARFLLGAQRAKATPEQLRAYGALADDFIAAQFAGQIDGLVAQKLRIGEARPRGAREVIVRTSFPRRDGSTVAVDWRVGRAASGEPELLDVFVNGVSPLVAKREEFSSLVTRQGFEALLQYMRAEIES